MQNLKNHKANATLDCHAPQCGARNDDSSIRERLEALQSRIPKEVKLVAATKGHSVGHIQQLLALDVSDIGENYWQEAKLKQVALAHLPIVWHFLGRLQANKLKYVARHFDWVHSLASYKHAQILDAHRASLPPLQVCIEVNVDEDPHKAGILPVDVPPFVKQLESLAHLKLRGLMTMPIQRTDQAQQRLPFRQLRLLLEEVNQQGAHLDTLSMGMSDDFEAAILEGSTLLRIGTALLGARP